jgi:hypothetical protein
MSGTQEPEGGGHGDENTMGVVLVTALIENHRNVDAADEGRIPDSLVRRFEVSATYPSNCSISSSIPRTSG